MASTKETVLRPKVHTYASPADDFVHTTSEGCTRVVLCNATLYAMLHTRRRARPTTETHVLTRAVFVIHGRALVYDKANERRKEREPLLSGTVFGK